MKLGIAVNNFIIDPSFFAARSRLASGTHVPHPLLRTTTVTTETTWTFDRRLVVYVDGVRVVTHSHPRDLRFRYVVIGTDSSPGDAYGPQHDVLYKDIKVYSSP